MAKPLGAQNGENVKPTGAKIGANGKNGTTDRCDKVLKSVKMVKWQIRKGVENLLETLKQAGPTSGAHAKMIKPTSGRILKLVKW